LDFQGRAACAVFWRQFSNKVQEKIKMRKLLLFASAAAFAALLAFAFVACGDEENTGLSIGDMGPGGGTVFFASGGQYKEYSAEFGALNWSAANAAARAHRGGDFTDWRLPDSGEALQVAEHARGPCWSSTPSSSGQYWIAVFNVRSSLTSRPQNALVETRAVRSFTIESNDPGIIGKAMLTIKNESGFELTDVRWNNVSFANPGIVLGGGITLSGEIKPGTSVTMNVPDGSGFIRFKPKANPVALRSQELVIVGKDEQREFIFLNTTLVVDDANTGNTGTLASFASR
jgi:hypothetical protein